MMPGSFADPARLLFFLAIVAAASGPDGATAGSTYILQRPYVTAQEDFFSSFWFCDGDDPRHGHVAFKDHAESQSLGLVKSGKEVFIGVDTKTVKSGSGRPRSVRILSRSAYSSGLFVLRVAHVPTGCGLWPAFKFYGGRGMLGCVPGGSTKDLPSILEFDILESVHQSNSTNPTLHTSFTCDQAGLVSDPAARHINWQQGQSKQADNCHINAGGQWANQGCAQQGPPGSMGQKINDRGGGTYATELDPVAQHIRVWFWPDGAEPPELRPESDNRELRPESWDNHFAYFRLGPYNCPAENFEDLRLAFDIDFCGDYGNPTFKYGCPKHAAKATCEEYVSTHPGAFKDAFWSIRGLDVYQKVSDSAASRHRHVVNETAFSNRPPGETHGSSGPAVHDSREGGGPTTMELRRPGLSGGSAHVSVRFAGIKETTTTTLTPFSLVPLTPIDLAQTSVFNLAVLTMMLVIAVIVFTLQMMGWCQGIKRKWRDARGCLERSDRQEPAASLSEKEHLCSKQLHSRDGSEASPLRIHRPVVSSGSRLMCGSSALQEALPSLTDASPPKAEAPPLRVHRPPSSDYSSRLMSEQLLKSGQGPQEEPHEKQATAASAPGDPEEQMKPKKESKTAPWRSFMEKRHSASARDVEAQSPSGDVRYVPSFSFAGVPFKS